MEHKCLLEISERPWFFVNQAQLSTCYKAVLSVQVTPTDRQICGGLLLSLMRVQTCIVYSRTIDQYFHSEQICTQLFFISRHRITIFPTKNPAASVEKVKSHAQFIKVSRLTFEEGIIYSQSKLHNKSL